ncbi:MAG: zinc ABC transporter substrate-binding protein [Clostridia bacterium]|nr:zinc ABC transporter substrate-binding protein [Clostridia bacterium]
MKKIISICLLLAVLLTGALAGCKSEQPGPSAGGKISVVTTIFPICDWVRQIAGDHADVTILLDNGVDLHSYQPTAQDIIKLTSADLFLYIGGESDKWVQDALKEAPATLETMNLMETLGDAIKEEEVVEGMEAEEEAKEAEEADEGPEYDEHIWLSLKNAAVLCQAICDRLCAIDAANAVDYRANAQAYLAKLNALDAAYQAAVDAAPVKTLLFGDRFPFRYLTEDYGLDYYAAFVGCSAESEASFQTIAFLAQKVDELGLHAILQIETSDGSIANTIRQTSTAKDQKILTMNSLQGASDENATYLSVMQANLDVLKEALQ